MPPVFWNIMNLPDVVGLIGVICYQIAYAGLQLGRFSQRDARYIGLNILGPGCLLFSLFFYFNLASFVTQVLWMCLTILGLAKIWGERRKPAADSPPSTLVTVPTSGVSENIRGVPSTRPSRKRAKRKTVRSRGRRQISTARSHAR